MPYKIPKIPIFPELLGTEKRVQDLQQKIFELDWLEYSFGLAKRVTIERGEEIEQAPVVHPILELQSTTPKIYILEEQKRQTINILMEQWMI